MSSGSNQAITYEEVAAYQADQGVTTYSGSSGGYTTGGIYVEWENPGGFTSSGWFNTEGAIKPQYSPVYGMSDDEITQAITVGGGTLDTVFYNWIHRIGYEERYGWIFDNVPSNCRYERI